MSGYLRSAVVLCAEGLHPDQGTKKGITAVGLARQREYPEVADFLQSETGCLAVAGEARRMADFEERYQFAVAVAECLDGKARRCTNAGFMLPKEETSSREFAMVLYEKGCTQGSKVRCSNLGLGYQKGWLGVADTEQARRLFRKACEAGHDKACERLGRL